MTKFHRITIFILACAFAVYATLTQAAYGAGAAYAAIAFLIVLFIEKYIPDSWLAGVNSISRFGDVAVVFTAALFLLLFWHSILQNPYRHMVMIGDAVQHIQWAYSIIREGTVKIATFSWPEPPADLASDPVFSHSFTDRSAHIFYFYGYFISGTLATLFYALFPMTGHHILFIATMVYVVGTYAIYQYLKSLDLKMPSVVAFCFLWAANPMMIASIFNGGAYEFIGIALLPLLFHTLKQKRLLPIFISSVLLAGTSRFFCYYLIVAAFAYLILFRRMKITLSLIVPALVFLAISKVGFESSIASSISGMMKAPMLPAVKNSLEQYVDAFLYNGNLLIFLFAYTGFASYAAWYSKGEERPYILFILFMLSVGFATLLMRSYNFAFTRNCIIITPVFILSAIGWRNITSMRSQSLALPIFLLGVAVFSTLSWKWSGPDMLYHWNISDNEKNRVADIRACSDFIDGYVGDDYEKIAVSGPRSLEGAFLHKPNRWFFDWRQPDSDGFVIVENGEEHMSKDYHETIAAYLQQGKIKPIADLDHTACRVHIYKKTSKD